MSQFAIDCAALDCTTLHPVAAVQLRDCPKAPNRSEVNSIILLDPINGTPITNWGSGLIATDFNIDNTDATAVAQKQFFGKGNLAVDDGVAVTLNDFKSVDLTRIQTLTFEIYDIEPATYDYFRSLQCGNLAIPKLYFTTVSDMIYGAADGILLTSFKVAFPLDEGEDGVEKIIITATIDDKVAPDRFDYPL